MPESKDRFPHLLTDDFTDSEAGWGLMLKELLMLDFITCNKISDKPDWDRKPCLRRDHGSRVGRGGL